MDTPRFYCPAITPPVVSLDAAEARHALLSLRLRQDDAVQLFDGRGSRARGRIAPTATTKPSKADRSAVRVQIDALDQVLPPTRTLTLIAGGCKGPRLDWLVEKCTELGVSRLVFARFERSVVLPGAGHIEKLRRAAIEACKQCGRDWLPEFATEIGLAAAVAAEYAAGAALFVAHPEVAAGDARSTDDRFRASRPYAAVIGPEGGLTAAELESLRSAGAAVVHLGAHILRVETAAAAVAALFAAAG